MATAPELESAVPESALPDHKPAFLRRVQIRGYKSIAFCDVTLEPLTILVGRNASGKSNFLDALGFVRDVLKYGAIEAVNRHGGQRSVLYRYGSSKQIKFVLHFDHVAELEIYQVEYSFEIEFQKTNRPEIASESAIIQYDGTRSTYGFHRDIAGIKWDGDDDYGINFWPIDKLLLSTFGRPPYLLLGGVLQDIFIYNFRPDAIRLLQKPSSVDKLERDGRNLASTLRAIEEQDASTARRISQYVTTIVKEIAGFETVQYGEYETVRFRSPFGDGQVRHYFDAASMSDGTLRALAAVTAAFQNCYPIMSELVAIEEPETALHPAAVHVLVDALDEATLRSQILLTTHSGDILDNPTIKPENVRVVQVIEGKTVITPVDEASVEIVKLKLGRLGELERENQLEANLDDIERQRLMSLNGSGGKP